MAKKPKFDAPKSDPGETHEFVALHTILRGGDTYEPGDPVELDADGFAELKAVGAIEGEWPPEQAPSA